MISKSIIVLASFAMLAVPFNTFAQVDTEGRQSADQLAKVAALAADSIPWKYKAVTGAGFNMVQLSNWAGGGQNSVTIRGLFLGSLDYAQNNFSWDNDLDLGYSITNQGDQGYRKADDRIILTSKASMKQNEVLRYTGLLDFRTQFAIGFNYDQRDPRDSTRFQQVSTLMAPGYLTGAIGMEWTPVKEFTLLASPLSSRAIFVLDDYLASIGSFGVDSGQSVKADLGGLLNATLDWEVFENVRWKSRVNAFMRYRAPDLWVVTVENAVLLKVNSFLSVGFLTDIFYDDRVPITRDDKTVGPSTQLRNQLVINFTHTFSN